VTIEGRIPIAQIVCVVVFWVGMPLLLAARVRRPSMSWWLVIALATALGWLAVNAAIYGQHRAIAAQIEQDGIAAQNALNETHAVFNGREMIVENPYPFRDYIVLSYRPLGGLAYGGLYLLACALPYWLMAVRRRITGARTSFALMAVGVFAIQWTLILGDISRRGIHSIDVVLLDPFLSPPMTISIALVTSWILVTQVIQRTRQTQPQPGEIA
jgi:hypothetical protein